MWVGLAGGPGTGTAEAHVRNGVTERPLPSPYPPRAAAPEGRTLFMHLRFPAPWSAERGQNKSRIAAAAPVSPSVIAGL